MQNYRKFTTQYTLSHRNDDSEIIVIAKQSSQKDAMFHFYIIDHRQIWYECVGLLIIYGYIPFCITCD